MSRAIELARNAVCTAPPNPTVGAVIVCDGRIIGEGYHVHCGQGHAEVNAIASVRDEKLLRQSTIYVSLEPCSHYGKTPPCADLIIRKGIPRVVVGCIDPFSLVSGRGVKKLRDAGVDVTVGVLEQECKNLIKRFVVMNTQGRPYITLKWAQSADGYIDVIRSGGCAARLSTPVSMMHVHRQRAEHKAILVGRRTALLDNPSLTVREWHGSNPVRMVIDRELTLPEGLHLFDGSAPTVVFTAREAHDRENVSYHLTDFSRDIIPQILQYAFERKLQSLLVEGGSVTLQSFIDSEQWDEMFIEHSACRLHGGVSAPTPPRHAVRDFFLRDGVTVEHLTKA